MAEHKPNNKICPGIEDLAAHARNPTGGEETSNLELHLAECQSCLHRYLEMVDSSSFPNIPDCRLIREIGRGRFGVVYKAWWLHEDPRLIALKVLSSTGKMETIRFDREITVLERLNSPGIVKCLHSGSEGENKYYLMDYVDGVHLDEYLAGRISDLAHRLGVFQRVCQAVADAHAMGVVHRDLKPRNILVDRYGSPHVLDFGICTVSRSQWGSWTQDTITQPGDLIGTLKYMSPEQAWGGASAPISERSDVWALGIMLHEIVTNGGYPYPLGSTPEKPPHEALLDRIRKELPRLPKLKHLPRGGDLETLLERCLAWEPRHRLPSAGALAVDLQRHLSKQPMLTRPFTAAHRVKRVAVGAAIHARWVLGLAWIAALGVMLQGGARAFRIGWLVGGIENLAVSAEQPSSTRDSIVVVGINDQTTDEVQRFAAILQLPGVDSNLTSWRAVHGHVMKRLASARPHAVFWDFFFRSPQPADGDLVAGIQRLEESGVPVILASMNHDLQGRPDLSPGITVPLGRALRQGAIVARDMVETPGEFVLAVRRAEGATVPGVSLTTLAALLHPTARLRLEWPGRGNFITLHYETQPNSFLFERDRIDFTRSYTLQKDEPPLRQGDQLACMKVPLDRPEQWAARTIAYQSLFTLSDDELRAAFAGRVVLFGNLRSAASGEVIDRHPVQYDDRIESQVPGCYLMADVISSLMEGHYFRSGFPLPLVPFMALLTVGILGCLGPAQWVRRGYLDADRHRRVVSTLLWVALIGGALVAIRARSALWVYTGLTTFSFAVPAIGMLWVELSRNRHRRLDKLRAALESLNPIGDGTITLEAP